MDLLARRSHFRAELVGKLGRKGYESEEIEAALDRLTEQGLIDDHRTAEEFVRSRLARQPTGRFKIQQDLMRRGVDADLAESVLSRMLDGEAELERAREAAERWWVRRAPVIEDEEDWEARRNRRAALTRHLERRGFARHAIVAAVRETEDAAVSAP